MKDGDKRSLRQARRMRRLPTPAESKLWRLLRDRRLSGTKFRRQHPFGEFVLDFFCHEARLVIELDGGGHADPAQAAMDAKRTAALKRASLKVVRFWNSDLVGNPEGVIERIWAELGYPTG